MEEKKEEDLYRNFSRKDLQGLCKKYGLPANKSNSGMATSLILYLEKKNISSKTVWEVSRSDPYSSLWSELQPEVRMNSTGNKRKDLIEISSHNGFGQFLKHVDQDQNDFGSCKTSEDMGRLTQLHRHSNSGAGDAENAFSSVLSSTAEASLPTFTYNVTCEDGIQLFVDLNSSTSDWVETLKAGVHICQDMHDLKSSNSDEKKSSLPVDAHNSPQLEDESCPTTVGTSVAFQAEEFGGGSLLSPEPKSFRNTDHYRGVLPEEQLIFSSKSKHDTALRSSEFTVRKGNEMVLLPHKVSGTTMSYDPKWSKTGDGVYNERCWQQMCSASDPVLKNCRLSGTPFVDIEASRSFNSLQHCNVASSSSRVASCLVSAGQTQKSGIGQFGPFIPGQLRGDVHQMSSVQAIDQSPYAPSSYLVRRLSDVGNRVGIEHGGASIPSKSSSLAQESQTQSVQSCEKTRTYFPFQGLPLTNPTLAANIVTGNGGFINSHQAGRKKVKLPKKGASLGPLNIGGPQHFAVPKKNHVDHHVFNYSNNLDKDVGRGQVRSNLGNSQAGDGNNSSEFNKFRHSMGEPWVKPTISEYNEFRMKRHFGSADDQPESVSPKMKLMRPSNQFSGDDRASRKRSMRPLPK